MSKKTKPKLSENYSVRNFSSRTEKQKELIDSITNKEITIATGVAGSGKTIVSLATALSLLGDIHKKIVLIKSVTTIPGESIGYVPGDANEKMENFIISYTENIDKLLGKGAAKDLLSKDILQVLPIAYVRGVTIDNAVVIIDECVSGSSEIYVESNSKSGLYRNSISTMKEIVKNFSKGKEIKVLTHNDLTGELEYKKVLNARSTGIKKVLAITLQQRSAPIKTSFNHPFAIYKNGNIEYVSAEDLKVGDRLLLAKNGKNNHTILNDNNLDIYLGFLLGDGYLGKNKQVTPNIYRLKKQHGMCQLEYCNFSSRLLQSEVAFTGKSGYTQETQPIIQTKSLYINPEFIKTLYDQKGKKRITEEISKYFTPRTLALWYMDDGSVNIYKEDACNSSFHTEGFSYEENEILSDILLSKFGIENSINKYNKNGNTLYYININKEGSFILHDIIKEYVYDSMQYKLLPKYRGFFNEDLYYTYKNFENITTKLITDIDFIGEEEVFNIEVEDNNNYFVNGVLTHNCQNVDMHTFLTIITRIGEDSKYIFLGDTEQIDRRKKEESCLLKVVNLFKEDDIIGTVEFKDEDCVRNPIIPKILEKLRTIL